jgi:hypothetical protein
MPASSALLDGPVVLIHNPFGRAGRFPPFAIL